MNFTSIPFQNIVRFGQRTMLEDQIFDAQRIVLSRRVFSKAKGPAGIGAQEALVRNGDLGTRQSRKGVLFAAADDQIEY